MNRLECEAIYSKPLGTSNHAEQSSSLSVVRCPWITLGLVGLLLTGNPFSTINNWPWTLTTDYCHRLAVELELQTQPEAYLARSDVSLLSRVSGDCACQ